MTAQTEVLGREVELAVVAAFLDRARSGPAGLLLSGPAGIGKTTIWRAGQSTAERSGSHVLMVRGAEAEARMPFSGLIGLLEPVADVVLPDLPQVQAAALAVALRRSAPLEAESDPLTISLATFGAMRTLAADRNLLIAVDDLQWLDASSRRALEFAARRLRSESIGWLVTARTGQPDTSRALVNALSEASFEILEVGALPLVALERLLRERLGASFLRPTLLRIERASAGNPFFALELGRALLGRGIRFAPEVLPVPEDIGGLLRDRLESLSSAAREAVLIAAALPSPTRRAIAAALGGELAAVGLQEAIQAGVLERDGEDVRFTHPLFASTAYDHSADEKRRTAHASIAAHAADPEERARHLALASDRRSERVARALEEAAKTARNRGSPEAAAELSHLALRRTPQRRAQDARRRGIAAARYLMQAGDSEQARIILEELLMATSSYPARAEILVSLADTYRGGDSEMAIRLLTEAAEQAGESLARVAAERRLASVAWTTLGDLSKGREHARTAVQLAEAAGDVTELAGSLVQVAWLDWNIDHAVPRELLDRIAGLHTQMPSALFESMLNARGLILLWEGEVDASRDVFLAARDQALRMGDWYALAHPLLELVTVELVSGHWARGLEIAQEAEAVGHLIGHHLIEAAVLIRSAHVLAHLGRVDEARQAGERGLALSRELGALQEESYALRVLGFLELSLGDAAAAHQRIGPSLVRFRAAGAGPRHVFDANDFEALVILGQFAEAEAALEPFERHVFERDHAWSMAISARCRGLLLAAAGDGTAAVHSLQEALAIHDRVPVPFERARTLLVLGEIQRRDRRRGAARESLRAALAEFERLGASLWVRRARRSLARIGEPGASGRLTETDRHIIELVTAGQSNRQVAAALFMSPHTVDTHLRRIYRVLGIKSRAQLAHVTVPTAGAGFGTDIDA